MSAYNMKLSKGRGLKKRTWMTYDEWVEHTRLIHSQTKKQKYYPDNVYREDFTNGNLINKQYRFI